jgi:exonuclease III
MKIITWNCAGRFAKSADALFAENPDIAIIQECLSSTIDSLKGIGYSSLWFGNERQKGVAIFCKENWKISLIAAPNHNWVIPLRVAGPENFTLIAVWSCPPAKGNQAYIKLIRSALEENRPLFTDGPVIVAGDFNSNSQWDLPRSRNHEKLVSDLERMGLRSVYHSHFLESQGNEKKPTFHWQWKLEQPFHIDYIFAPHNWLPRVHHFEIGEHSRWGNLSDHLPLTAIFASADS